MVIYDFKCSFCEYTFEQRREMGDNSPATCPKCGGDARKIISAPSIVMNWHNSDSVHESKRYRGRVLSPALK